MKDVIHGQFLIGVQLVRIKFSFSLTGCRTKAKQPILSDYLHMNGSGENRWIHASSHDTNRR